jgi:cytoskeletal protein CcmA (bactofilin family)
MKRKLSWKLLTGLFVLALLLVGIATPAQAFTSESGNNVVIEEGQVIEGDYYVAANTFTLRGTIKGDLIAFGTLITIDPTGVVEGDILGAGQVIYIRGSVQDDARIAGMLLSIADSAKIDGDLVGAGYAIDMSSGSQVGGDMLFFGNTGAVAGSIAGMFDVAGAGLMMDGTVGKDMSAEVGAAQQAPPFDPTMFMQLPAGSPPMPRTTYGLAFGPNAKVGGNLDYTSPTEVQIPAGVVAGQVNYTVTPTPAGKAPPPPPTPAEKAFTWFVKVVRNFVSLLIIGLLFAYLGPRCWRESLQTLKSKPWLSLLWGFLGYIGYYLLGMVITILIIFLMVILGFLTLGKLVGVVIFAGLVLLASLTLIFYLLTSFMAKVVVAALIGMLIIGLFASSWNEKAFIPLILGLLIYVLLASIPFLGFFVDLFAILFGLGALLLICADWWNARKQKPVPATETVQDTVPVQ